MAWRAVIYSGIRYLRRLRQFPSLFLRFSRFRPPGTNAYLSKLSLRFRTHANPNSLVRTIYRAVISGSTHQRPNSLLRAYSGLAGSVHLRHQFNHKNESNLFFGTINKVSKRTSSWFGGLFGSAKRYPTLPNFITNSSALSPKEFIAAGCNSAVWSAEIQESVSLSPEDADNTKTELAVKVLYNYYASNPDDRVTLPVNEKTGDVPLAWVLLHRQLHRECELRPSTGHPNIVPLFGHFIDRAPANTTQPVNINNSGDVPATHRGDSDSASTSQLPASTLSEAVGIGRNTMNTWKGAELFPEAFGGRPLTFYMLMPRFEATLDDLLHGSWNPFLSSSESHVDITNSESIKHSESGEPFLNTSAGSSDADFNFNPLTSYPPPSDSNFVGPHKVPSNSMTNLITTEDAVAILAQLFDAIAELELHGIAHRDVKPNNILLRKRSFSRSRLQQVTIHRAQYRHRLNDLDGTKRVPNLDWLDDNEVQLNNSHFHVALTDFGCAIRTRPALYSTTTRPLSSIQSALERLFEQSVLDSPSFDDHLLLAHSGNLTLLAPEIATNIHSRDPNVDKDTTYMDSQLSSQDYTKTDMWAAATLCYPLFGMSNPFSDGTLSSETYKESELPSLPDHAPGVITWLVTECLQRNPFNRPEAALVADVLHTWCLVYHMCRRISRSSSNEKSISRESHFPRLNYILENFFSQTSESKLNLDDHQLHCLLNLFWAADWLTGPARPPEGLRISYYSRITPGRLAFCLQIVHREEIKRSRRLADSIVSFFNSLNHSVVH